jgi:hypothetical protein
MTWVLLADTLLIDRLRGLLMVYVDVNLGVILLKVNI